MITCSLARMALASLSLWLAVGLAAQDPVATLFGYLRREFFPGATMSQVESNPGLRPSIVHLVTKAEAPVNIDNNFSQRISGYFVPPTNGLWYFAIASDDASKLYLSTDEKPANKRLIAEQPTWGRPNEWLTAGNGSVSDGFNVSQKTSLTWSPDGNKTRPYSSGISLVAGKLYYIEAVMREDAGLDNLSFTAKRMGEVLHNDEPTTLTGSNIAVRAVIPASIGFAPGPSATNVVEFSSVMFGAEPDCSCDIISYQWLRNGKPIENATNKTFTEIAFTELHGAQYALRASVPPILGGTAATSSPAKLSIKQGYPFMNIIKREVFSGKTLPALRIGAAGLPDRMEFVDTTSTPTNQIYYAQRLSGLFIPTNSGRFHFVIASDDQADLYLSTNGSPANKQLIAQQLTWGGKWEWSTAENGNRRTGPEVTQKNSASFVVPGSTNNPNRLGIALQAGNAYYFEIHHEQQLGDANLAITFYNAASRGMGLQEGSPGPQMPPAAISAYQYVKQYSVPGRYLLGVAWPTDWNVFVNGKKPLAWNWSNNYTQSDYKDPYWTYETFSGSEQVNFSASTTSSDKAQLIRDFVLKVSSPSTSYQSIFYMPSKDANLLIVKGSGVNFNKNVNQSSKATIAVTTAPDTRVDVYASEKLNDSFTLLQDLESSFDRLTLTRIIEVPLHNESQFYRVETSQR